MRKLESKDEERVFINDFARKWNYKLLRYLPTVRGAKWIIGWIHIENMLKIFLRTYNWRQNERKD